MNKFNVISIRAREEFRAYSKYVPPYMAPSNYTNKYCSDDMVLPEFVDPGNLGDRLAKHHKALRYDKISESDLKETMRYYHASVEWGVDLQIGEILQTLEGKGMFLYDALLHVPLIWYAPGHIKQGLSFDNMTQCVDIFPTLLELAGTKNQDQLGMVNFT